MIQVTTWKGFNRPPRQDREGQRSWSCGPEAFGPRFCRHHLATRLEFRSAFLQRRHLEDALVELCLNLDVLDRVGQADRGLKAAEAALGLPPR